MSMEHKKNFCGLPAMHRRSSVRVLLKSWPGAHKPPGLINELVMAYFSPPETETMPMGKNYRAKAPYIEVSSLPLYRSPK